MAACKPAPCVLRGLGSRRGRAARARRRRARARAPPRRDRRGGRAPAGARRRVRGRAAAVRVCQSAPFCFFILGIGVVVRAATPFVGRGPWAAVRRAFVASCGLGKAPEKPPRPRNARATTLQRRATAATRSRAAYTYAYATLVQNVGRHCARPNVRRAARRDLRGPCPAPTGGESMRHRHDDDQRTRPCPRRIRCVMMITRAPAHSRNARPQPSQPPPSFKGRSRASS